MVELSGVREAVRERYARAARAAAARAGDRPRSRTADPGCCGSDSAGSHCCGSDSARLTPADDTGAFGAGLYDEATRALVPDAAVSGSMGCGVPTAVAALRDGEIVLDLGSGAGADVLISARRVAPSGLAIGLDMTDEMLDLARANAAQAGVENVEFVKGYIEAIPLPDSSVDVVISNCVINLSADKPRVIAESARVLRPGGRFAISDVIADSDIDAATRADIGAWTGCIAGALTEAGFRSALASAGLQQINVNATHRVHEHAASAIIRARKPRAR